MSGRIDKHGSLHLDKDGIQVPQCCPHQRETACGHWCPHFTINGMTVTICRETLFAGIIDERDKRRDRFEDIPRDDDPPFRKNRGGRPPRKETPPKPAKQAKQATGKRPGGKSKLYWLESEGREGKIARRCPKCETAAITLDGRITTHCRNCGRRIHERGEG